MAFRRQVKNVVRNFTDIEVKVREATSNDPWGPSSSLMGEIADATYNVSAFSSIMSMLWKRLNDHGKNWRHVYKSLTVLDYIIKTGSERVAQQCRENLFAIQTLKDFQFIDKDGKDQGINVREKSKQIVALLKDDERLKNERQRALKAKERFAQSQGGVGNSNFQKQNKKFTPSGAYPTAGESVGDHPKTTQDDSSIPTWNPAGKTTEFDSRSSDGRLGSEFEKARPTNEQEEEMQLQIALAMSREEAEHDQKLGISDEKRLAIALQKSGTPSATGQAGNAPSQASTLLDLTAPSPDVKNQALFDVWTAPIPQNHQLSQGPPVSQPVFPPSIATDPWGAPQSTQSSTQPFNAAPQAAFPAVDPWSANPPSSEFPAPQPNPWESATSAPVPVAVDPWGPSSLTDNPQDTMFMPQSIESNVSNGFDPREVHTPLQPAVAASNPFDMSAVNNALVDTNSDPFLGKTSKLVNLEDIVGAKATEQSINPFATTIGPKTTNPFAAEKPKAKSINELRSQQTSFVSGSEGSTSSPSGILLPTPLAPQANNAPASNTANPFLL